MKESKNILIAAGGSGGHLLPAAQIAKLLQKKDGCKEVLFMGSGLSKSAFFQKKEFRYHEIPSSSIRKKNPFRLFLSLCKLLQGALVSRKLLKKEKIDLVVGFGSYHSFPVLLAAKTLKIPIVLFEANSVLGKVNAFFAKGAKKLALQFPLSENTSYSTELVEKLPWVQPKKITSQEEARRELGLAPDLFTFLVFGGSQGASYINKLFLQAAASLQKNGRKFQVIHLTGNPASEKEMQDGYREMDIVHYVRAFESDMPRAFAAADLVLCRSGASTIAELIYFEKPAILIPFPYAAENHQEVNARYLRDVVGGGILMEEKKASLDGFLQIFETIFKDDQVLTKMQTNIKQFKIEEQKLRKKNFADLILEVEI